MTRKRVVCVNVWTGFNWLRMGIKMGIKGEIYYYMDSVFYVTMFTTCTTINCSGKDTHFLLFKKPDSCFFLRSL